VTAADGPWQVVHPFTGLVEFSTSERLLAEAVRDTLDAADPVSVKWIYETYSAVPPAHRRFVEWVMSGTALRELLKATEPTNGALYSRAFNPLDVEMMLGRPVVIDDAAVGIHLRPVT
jgi:predicted phage gp36 major capsid-like protein